MTFSLSKRFIICATILFFAYTNAKLVVKYPPSLSEEFDKVNGIDYMVLTPQNKITYKRAFIGILTLADPSNACEHIDSISDIGADSVYNPILLTTWGDCHYAQKVKNAEDAGAKMVLVVLQHEMAWDHPAVRSLTINTNVEVLAVSKADGDKLIEYIKQQKEQNKESAVEVTYSYEIEKHVNYQNSDTVLIDFWFTTGDVRKDAYTFLDNFHDVLAEFGSTVSFNPHYVLWECEGCNDDKRCILNGKYCDPEPLIANKIPGKEAVDETLRQICLREINTRTPVDGDWWKYVSAFGEQCVDKDLDDLKDCRDKIWDSMDTKITSEVQNCIVRDLAQSQAMGGGNSQLSKELNLRDEMHIDHYPALYVNKEKYTGSLRNKNVMRDFLCSHFTQDTLPAPCVAAPIIAEQTYSGSDVGVYIALIIVSILVMAVMIYCVRRSVKRQVMFRMNDEISHIVTQYKQFKDKSNSFSIDEDT